MSWVGRSIAKMMCSRPVRISDYEIETHEIRPGVIVEYTLSCIIRLPAGNEEYWSHTFPGRPFSEKKYVCIPATTLNGKIREKYPKAVL